MSSMPARQAATASQADNQGEQDYPAKIGAIAQKLAAWQGRIVIISHEDPDGDALGSALALKRALEALGKQVTLPLTPPRFLQFLADPGELSEPLAALPEGGLLLVVDVEVGERATGAPLEGAAFIVNLDHHGTNPRRGDLVCVEPSRAATAHIVKDVIDALPVSWTPKIATPCLTGILTDTGNFRFSNTTPEVLSAAAALLGHGVAYAELTERLQLRHPDYFRMLGKVMATVEFPLEGRVALARLTRAMRRELGESEDDSDDYVGLIRYAEGVKVAILLKERGEKETKVSVRAREGVSAQNICLALGGGGHVAAAGATVYEDLETTCALALKAAEAELARAR
jgi:phosphoesterase RecJ-like protein